MEAWVRAALRCPRCLGQLRDVPAPGVPEADGSGGLEGLECTGECRSTYPVVDGVPVLLLDEARPPAGGSTA